MALDYRKCAQEIFDNLGGKDNIVSAAHCATRLRLVIADNSKLNKDALENVDGVKGMFENGGQLQLIIGTGTVNKVYDEFIDISGVTAASKDEVKAAAAAQQPVWKRMLKTIGDVFVPILPAIVASGLMMGLVEALGKIPGLNFADTAWYGFLDMAANTAFAFLPVIVAISAARVFGANIFLGAVMGLMMVHTGLLNAWNAGSPDAINAFFDIDTGVIPTWNLFGNIKIGNYVLGSIQRVGYQGHVIPVIISVFVMAQIEKWLHKHVPEMIDLFVTPLCTVLSTALLTFIIIGPIFSKLETIVLNGAQLLITVGFGIGALIMGAIYPVTVVMGLHHMYNVIEAGMLSSEQFNNLNIWMPIASSANFAQFGACLAVGLKCRSNKTKQVAIPSSMSAALGITEPAIFGVNMRFLKPFVCGMIGGAIGSMLGSWMGLGAKAYGVTGIPGYLTINKPLQYTIMLLVAGGIAFALTWFIWKEDEEALKKEQAKAEAAAAAEKAAAAFEAPTNYVMSCKEGKVLAPAAGEVVKREDIPDPTFASGLLGDGVGINPSVGIVVAPFDGTISSIAASKHAIGLTSAEGGMELLIHVGVDTVKMEGDGFEPQVNEGDTVKEGQIILKFSKDKIAEAGYKDCVVVLMANSDMMTDFQAGADV
ncbi:MAG: PTS glucose transporter subunit IIA [Eubacterium sp.]|nr:PTS glucose transporter subunit IIA [Eubacterium sp.]